MQRSRRLSGFDMVVAEQLCVQHCYQADAVGRQCFSTRELVKTQVSGSHDEVLTPEARNR